MLDVLDALGSRFLNSILRTVYFKLMLISAHYQVRNVDVGFIGFEARNFAQGFMRYMARSIGMDFI